MCVAAGTDPDGMDGWCNNDDECKCKGEGATCNTTTLHCTFTKPKTTGNDKGGCAVGEASGNTALFVLLAMAVLGVTRRRFALARPRR